MSHKIKNLMEGGRSRLEKRTTKKKKGKAVQEQAARSVEKSETPEPLKRELPGESISVTVMPDKPLLQDMPDNPADDVPADDLPPQMREGLRILLKNNITVDCMRAIEAMSLKDKDFMDSFLKLGPHAMAVFCNMAKDEDYVITTKIKLISLLNRISHNEIVHKLFRRVGAAIEALRRLKELLLLQ
ncbi:MAG: hypothetical protein HQK99_04595 [Nitrospirae bacterium]|nr:hypothetical protein [Nitrospirota bacterium]